MRQRLKSRINPRGRPHLKQRRTTRLLNLGGRAAFTIIDFLAIANAREELLGDLHSALQRELECFPA